MEEGGGKEEKVEGSGNDNCWLQRKEEKKQDKTGGQRRGHHWIHESMVGNLVFSFYVSFPLKN